MGVTNKRVRTAAQAAKNCVAVNEAVTLFREKWTILCLGVLAKADAPLRYSALHAGLQGISQRMLTLTLKTLEQNGLVQRHVFPTVPPRVEYALTSVGRTLVVPLKALLTWSLENRDAMEQARQAYARAASA